MCPSMACAKETLALWWKFTADGLEVEFVTASGSTAALVTLNSQDVRPAADDDLVSVRRRSA